LTSTFWGLISKLAGKKEDYYLRPRGMGKKNHTWFIRDDQTTWGCHTIVVKNLKIKSE
jgi:hypothetical protein